MTSYLRAAERGRAAAHETNTAYKLRTIVEYREEHRQSGWTFTHQALVGLLIGECGHTLKSTYQPRDRDRGQVGKRMRCRQCPADPTPPLPADHCQYGIANEAGERPCPTRAVFIDPNARPGFQRLCTRHHNHLLRGGYLDAPCPRFQRAPGPVQYLQPPAPPVPSELSPPVRGHIRLVQN